MIAEQQRLYVCVCVCVCVLDPIDASSLLCENAENCDNPRGFFRCLLPSLLPETVRAT